MVNKEKKEEGWRREGKGRAGGREAGERKGAQTKSRAGSRRGMRCAQSPSTPAQPGAARLRAPAPASGVSLARGPGHGHNRRESLPRGEPSVGPSAAPGLAKAVALGDAQRGSPVFFPFSPRLPVLNGSIIDWPRVLFSPRAAGARGRLIPIFPAAAPRCRCSCSGLPRRPRIYLWFNKKWELSQGLGRVKSSQVNTNKKNKIK